MKINPLFAIDFYKSGHHIQYPKGTTEIYSNFTARSGKHSNMGEDFDNKVVFFGLDFLLNELSDLWVKEFFLKRKSIVCKDYKYLIEQSLGIKNFDVSHFEKLHDLGYLPIQIKSLQEGQRVPFVVPLFTIKNTHPDFFWLTNFLETYISSEIWKPITIATKAFEFRKILEEYALKTGSNISFTQLQVHDFSFRGMSGMYDAAKCGAAHLTSFIGTDCIPAIQLIKDCYIHVDPVGISIPATEHSVMCMGKIDNEYRTFERLITEVYPSGFVSIVSDTWDYFSVLTNILPKLKDKILYRDGKVVIRPDSGDPEDIICKSLPILWDIFGGTINDKGFKELNPKIGLIYGDSITLEIAKNTLERMMKEGFASSNIVFGVGSYSYQYVTRDTFGFAMKATSGIVNGERINIFKNPKTDDGTKKSLKGLLKVGNVNNEFIVYDEQSELQEDHGLLSVVFYDGKFALNKFSDIRHKINNEIYIIMKQKGVL